MKRKIIFLSIISLIFCICSCSVSGASDAVLVLHFDEGSGTIAHDSSGQGNDGTINGATWANGISGKALNFGGDDYVLIPNSNELNPKTQITIEAWIKPESGWGSSTDPMSYSSFGIISKVETPSQNGYSLMRFRTSDKMRFYPAGIGGGQKGNAADNNRFVASKQDIVPYQWTYYAATFDGTIIKMYVNGNLENSFTYSGGIVNNQQPLVIGRPYGNYNGYYFQGIIDEVAIYPRVLTAVEIQSHYIAKRADATPTPSPTPTPAPTTPKPAVAATIIKSINPHTIKQNQTVTITITIENTGTTSLSDIEMIDTTPTDFDFIGGDTQSAYSSLKPGESRTIQYIIQSRYAGKFILDAATARFADQSRNYQTINSNTPTVEVLAPLSDVPITQKSPGFGVVVSLIGLTAIIVILKRRR